MAAKLSKLASAGVSTPTKAVCASTALWYEAPRALSLRQETLPLPKSAPQTPLALIRTRCSYISRGTERLVFEGAVPKEVYGIMRAPMQEGDFPFPVKYGYCAVGDVVEIFGAQEEGSAAFGWKGARVFALAPHQSFFLAPLSMLHIVPEHIPDARASLAANMETALTALWDSGLSAGDRIIVIGAGMIGCLIAYLAKALPGADVLLVDREPARRLLADRLGIAFATAEELAHTSHDRNTKADGVFHCSATGEGLALAMASCGREAKLIEVSWYGTGAVQIALGAQFHALRLSLVASQVGAIPPARAPRWSHARRLETALRLLDNPALDCLIDAPLHFHTLPQTLPHVFYAGGSRAPGTVVAYSGLEHV